MKWGVCFLMFGAVLALCVCPAFCLIDVNTATQAELESLPGIGPVKAQRVIEGRPYKSVDELTRVKGIGPKTLDGFRDMITVGEAGGGAEVPPDFEEAPGGAQAPARTEVLGKIKKYPTDKFRAIRCWRCRNIFKVSDKLANGWCPYCNARWAAN